MPSNEITFCSNSSDSLLRKRVPVSGDVVSNRAIVLLVDDDELVLNLLSLSLEEAGHKVLVASNAREALALLSHLQDAIDLLVTDIHLPGMSGTELATAATGICGSPVLLISGESVTSEIQPAGWSFLAKPFTPNRFIGTVNDILARAGGKAQDATERTL